MSIQHFYSQTVADGTATSVVRPSDWNSSHKMVYNLSGNTLGSSQITGADVVFVGGNNVTLSADTANSQLVINGETAKDFWSIQGNTLGTNVYSWTNDGMYLYAGNNITLSGNGSTLTISAGAGGGGGVTLGKWEPFYPAGTTTSTPGLNSVYVQKLRPDNAVSFSYIERRMSNNFSSSSVAQSAGYTIDYGLYSRGAGTNSTRMELMGSSQIIMNAAMSSSSVSFTVSQGAASFTSGSASSALMSLITGFKHLYMPYTGTLSAGQEYWFAQRMSSSGTSNPLRVGFWEQSVINNLTVGKIYGSTVSASNASFVGDFNQGVYGTTTGAFPTSMAESQLTNAVSQNRMYLQFDDGV